ncbi:MAG TPA: Gmad2 immunoglobulin-like domain-containing protein, partial [Ktedonobacteraceae bacterium]|nr:Gmad2 immunoglobulin-like domain-containing protein [Ktedonobacteraceae bacterium]
IKLSLSRLEFNTNGGIWEVTEVTTDGLKITTPQSEQQLTSPVQVRGTNSAFVGNDATITMLDQDHTEISQTQSITGETNFSTSIVYASDIKGKEAQEGILVLNVYNGNHVLIGVTMVKVLLSA